MTVVAPHSPHDTPASVEARSAWRALLALDAVFILIFGAFAVLAPMGAWRNQIGFNTDWGNHDPGGIYVVNALSLFGPDRYAPWDGHPGLTLTLPIAIAAKLIFFGVNGDGDTDAFFSFWTYKIRWLFIAAGLLIPVIHVASFHALHAFVTRLIGNHRTAFFAVLCYATLLPTLFFGARIGPEPLLVLTFLLTFITTWKSGDALAAGDDQSAARWAGLAGFCAVAALYTKAHLAGPLVLFAPIQLLFQRMSPESAPALRRRWRSLITWLVVAVATFAAGMWKVDWLRFAHYWHAYLPGAAAIPSSPDSGPAPEGVMDSFLLSTVYHVEKFLPSLRDHRGIFTLCEGIFLVVSLLGTYRLLRRPNVRTLLIWPILYCVLIFPVLLFRGSWHYMFLHLAVLTPGAAAMLCDAAVRMGRPIWVWGFVFVIHSTGIVLVMHSRVHDIRVYRAEFEPYHRALERLSPGRTLIVITPTRPTVWKLVGADPQYMPWTTPFQHRFADRIYTITDPAIITRDLIAKRKVQLVLDLTGEEPTIRSSKAYFSNEGER